MSSLPGGRGDGVPLTSLIELAAGAKIAQVICGALEQNVLLATTASYGFVCKLSDMTGRNKAGKQFFTIEGEEQILPPLLFTPVDDSWVVSVTRSGRLLAFPLAEMKRLAGGGKGLIVMGLEEGDTLAAILVECKAKLLVTTRTDAGREQQLRVSENDLQSHFGKRARMGKMLPLKVKTYVISIALVS